MIYIFTYRLYILYNFWWFQDSKLSFNPQYNRSVDDMSHLVSLQGLPVQPKSQRPRRHCFVTVPRLPQKKLGLRFPKKNLRRAATKVISMWHGALRLGNGSNFFVGNWWVMATSNWVGVEEADDPNLDRLMVWHQQGLWDNGSCGVPRWVGQLLAKLEAMYHFHLGMLLMDKTGWLDIDISMSIHVTCDFELYWILQTCMNRLYLKSTARHWVLGND